MSPTADDRHRAAFAPKAREQAVGSDLPLAVRIIEDAAEMVRLGPAWSELFQNAVQASASQSFEFARCGWETLPDQGRCRLQIVTIWSGARLEALWPLYVRRQGLARVACHLGCGDHHEYAGPLLRRGPEMAQVARAALAAARRIGDVLRIFNVCASSTLVEVLAAERGLMRKEQVRSPVVSLNGIADFDAWAAKASSKLRAELRSDRRRLSALGDLQFRAMSGPEDGARCMDWITAHKREWLSAHGIRRSFFLERQVEPFFKALAVRPPRTDGRPREVELLAVLLDDRILAACICLNSPDRLEFYTTTFDPAYSKYSPGTLMIQDCVSLAISRGVDFDFRISSQGYKLRWVDRFDLYATFSLATSLRGVPTVILEATGAGWHGLRVKYGPRVKALLGRASAGAH